MITMALAALALAWIRLFGILGILHSSILHIYFAVTMVVMFTLVTVKFKWAITVVETFLQGSTTATAHGNY